MPAEKKIPVVEYVARVSDNATVFRLEQPQMSEHDMFYVGKLCFTTSEAGAIPVDLGVFRHGVDIYLCTVNVTGPAWNSYTPGIWLPSEYRVFAEYRTLDTGDIARLNIFGHIIQWEDYP